MPAPERKISFLTIVRVFITVPVFILLVFFYLSSKKESLPVYAAAPSFSMTERSGKTMTAADLRGKVWIADFIFTRCAGQCPIMSAQMKRLTGRLKKASFVSFSTAGTFLGLLHPYALLVGVTTVALFMMHGSIYVVMKTEGKLHDKIRSWINPCIIFFIMCYAATTMATLLYVPHMTETIKTHPVFFSAGIVSVFAIANIPREIHHGRDFMAFLSSCVAMVSLMALFGLGMFPNLVYSLPNPENSLTVFNAASSPKTLWIMFIIACLGIPVVLAYTFSIYWIFRGKVKLDSSSY